MSAADSRLERVLARVGDLPAMPGIVAQVLRLADDPDADMNQIGDVLQRDPGLTAKILRVSNSSYYGMRQYVGTLKLALVILGVREVRNVVLGVSLFESMRNDIADDVLSQEFWSHSFCTASVCKELGARMKLKLQGEDFIAGLLHDIGKMVLCRQLGEKYANLYRRAKGEPAVVLELEREELGFTHAEAGAALCARWNLPKTLGDSIYRHHPSPHVQLSTAKDPQLAAVVRLSNLAVREQTGPPRREKGWTACADAEVWDVLRDVPMPIADGERQRVLSGIVQEVIAHPPVTF